MMSPIYSELDEIKNSLNQIQEPGAYYTKFTEPCKSFEIAIKNYGTLKLPLSKESAKELIQLAEHAKFGLGDKTILDLKVRNAWEVIANKITIKGKGKKKLFDNALQKIKSELGLAEKDLLEAELHNLLIYEEDQLFAPHQDSEKKKGMVASLVIILPSPYEGGAFQLDHMGDKTTITSEDTPHDQFTFIAFYADCHHEVLKVTKGYRVALTFNLILKTTEIKIKKRPLLEIQPILNESISNYFNKIESQETTKSFRGPQPKRLVYLLDYEYTPDGISWDTLKNIDILRAEALKNAAEKLGLDIYLCLAEMHETWDCIPDYNEWGSNYYEEDEDEINEYDSNDEENYSLGQLIDGEATAKHWMDITGKKMMFPEASLYGWDLIWSVATDDFEPFESEYEGYMGNYGNTEDRWYHRAAIILWRSIDSQAVFLGFNPGEVITQTLTLAKSKKTLAEAIKTVTQFIPYWKGFYTKDVNSEQKKEVIKLAVLLGDKSLGLKLLKPLGFDLLCPDSALSFKELIQTFGADWSIKLIEEWLPEKKYFNADKCIGIDKTVEKIFTPDDKQSHLFLDWLLRFQLNQLKKSHIEQKPIYQSAELQKLAPSRIVEILEVLAGCMTINAKKMMEEIFELFLTNCEVYTYRELSVCLITFSKKYKTKELEVFNFEKLINPIVAIMEKELKAPERSSGDWSIMDKNICNCADCKILTQFLNSQKESQKVWPLSKDRRQHIHRMIDNMILPVTHKTEHTGSPHKLKLNKTNQLFKQSKERRLDLAETLGALSKVLNTKN